MAIRTVVTRGFGNGTFNSTIALATLRGYKSDTPPAPTEGAVRFNPAAASVGKLMNR